MSWWAELFVGWVVFFLLPKSIIIPIFRGMYRSMRATEELDRRDAAWLAEQQGEGGAPVLAWKRRRPRHPFRPGGLGPLRHLLRAESVPRTKPPRVPS